MAESGAISPSPLDCSLRGFESRRRRSSIAYRTTILLYYIAAYLSTPVPRTRSAWSGCSGSVGDTVMFMFPRSFLDVVAPCRHSGLSASFVPSVLAWCRLSTQAVLIAYVLINTDCSNLTCAHCRNHGCLASDCVPACKHAWY